MMFVLPIPPSWNSAKGLNRRSAKPYTRKHVTEWRMQAAARLREQSPVLQQIDGPFLMTVNMQRPRSTADIDNRMKLLLDFFEAEHVIENDKLCAGFAAAWSPKGNNNIYVSLVPSAPLTIQFQPSKNDASVGGWFPSDAFAHTEKG